MIWLRKGMHRIFRKVTGWLNHPDIPRGCSAADCAVLHPTCRLSNNHDGQDAIFIGPHTHVKGELLTFGHGGRIVLGEYCYVGENAKIWSALSVIVGNRVLISHNANIFDNDTHPIDDPVARHRQFKEIITTGHPKILHLNERPVHIADDALICSNATILSGVTIGEGAVVAAGAVVTKDVPPYTVVAGNPARVIRQLAPVAPAHE